MTILNIHIDRELEIDEINHIYIIEIICMSCVNDVDDGILYISVCLLCATHTK
jgi:hypothetical protein